MKESKLKSVEQFSRFYRKEFCLLHWWRIAVFIIICMCYTQWGGSPIKIRMSSSTTTKRLTFQQHMWNFRVTFYALTKSQHCGLLIWLCWWPKWNSMPWWPHKNCPESCISRFMAKYLNIPFRSDNIKSS